MASEPEVLVIGPDREDNARFGAWLRGARDARKLPASAVAQVANVTPTYVRMVEQGKRAPAKETAVGLLRAAGAKVDLEPRLPGGRRVDLAASDPNTGQWIWVEIRSRVRGGRGSDLERAAAAVLATLAPPEPGAAEEPARNDALARLRNALAHGLDYQEWSIGAGRGSPPPQVRGTPGRAMSLLFDVKSVAGSAVAVGNRSGEDGAGEAESAIFGETVRLLAQAPPDVVLKIRDLLRRGQPDAGA